MAHMPPSAASRVVRYGKRGAVQRYKCKGCSFHLRTSQAACSTATPPRPLARLLPVHGGTPLRARHREEARDLKEHRLAWRHRAISALASADSHTICEGIVEVAQWPMIRSVKGSRPPEG